MDDAKSLLEEMAANASGEADSATAEAAAMAAGLRDGALVVPGDYWPYPNAGEMLYRAAGKQRKLFRRGALVVEITGRGELETVTADKLCSIADRACSPVYKFRKDSKSRLVMGPGRMVSAMGKILLLDASVDLLPPISLVTRAPLLLEDGTVLKPGYNPELGGVFVSGRVEVPEVPLDEAVPALRGLLRDFWFQTPSDGSRGMASLIAPSMKSGQLLGEARYPVEGAEANTSQAGKGMLVALPKAIHGEPSRMTTMRKGGVGSFDESVSAAILSGRRFVTFDNLRGRVDSMLLEMAITSTDPVAVRVPHRGEVEVDATKQCFSLTSNGVELTVDLGNRLSLMRIVKQPPGYAWHPWPEGRLETHVTANQPYYLGCVFSVLREWLRQGKPSTGERRHDMREWAGAMDWIVQNLFGMAPLLDGHQELQLAVTTPSWAWLRQLMLAVKAQGRLNRLLLANELVEIAREAALPILDGGREGDADTELMRIGQRLGAAFRRAEVESDLIVLDGLHAHRVRVEYRDEGNRDKHAFGYVIATEPLGELELARFRRELEGRVDWTAPLRRKY